MTNLVRSISWWRICLAIAATATFVVSNQAGAQSQLATFEASAVVTSRCRVESGSEIAFGELDPSRARDATAVATLRVACTRGTTFRLVADTGTGFDTARGLRTMRRSTSERLPYTFDMVGDRATAMSWNRPAEVSLRAHLTGADYQNLPGGTYEDVIRISVEY